MWAESGLRTDIWAVTGHEYPHFRPVSGCSIELEYHGVKLGPCQPNQGFGPETGYEYPHFRTVSFEYGWTLENQVLGMTTVKEAPMLCSRKLQEVEGFRGFWEGGFRCGRRCGTCACSTTDCWTTGKPRLSPLPSSLGLLMRTKKTHKTKIIAWNGGFHCTTTQILHSISSTFLPKMLPATSPIGVSIS